MINNKTYTTIVTEATSKTTKMLFLVVRLAVMARDMNKPMKMADSQWLLGK